MDTVIAAGDEIIVIAEDDLLISLVQKPVAMHEDASSPRRCRWRCRTRRC
jgi:hypothetical protein